ncbi:hypothetical protein P7K49_012187 [Saguinus oedipus]|uniref:Uncharacterized protein n=1 Tax=Saguinus oedipus TaxID=9490 RepID=A0ABQ9VTH0_SAGOE|nr:hypothetical protein P7K49_012187 [Saguinus oedipus]
MTAKSEPQSTRVCMRDACACEHQLVCTSVSECVLLTAPGGAEDQKGQRGPRPTGLSGAPEGQRRRSPLAGSSSPPLLGHTRCDPGLRSGPAGVRVPEAEARQPQSPHPSVERRPKRMHREALTPSPQHRAHLPPPLRLPTCPSLRLTWPAPGRALPGCSFSARAPGVLGK